MSDYINPALEVCAACGREAWARAHGDWLCFGCGLQWMQPRLRRLIEDRLVRQLAKTAGVRTRA